MAWHTIANLYYLMRPARGGADTRDFILDLIRFISVATTDTQGIRYALQLPMQDFEDAMQVAAARASGARLIVTRNLRDYERSPIPAANARNSPCRVALDFTGFVIFTRKHMRIRCWRKETRRGHPHRVSFFNPCLISGTAQA